MSPSAASPSTQCAALLAHSDSGPPLPPFDVKLCAPLQGITSSDSSADSAGQPASPEVCGDRLPTQTASAKLAALVESEELLTWGNLSAGPCSAVDAAARIVG